MHPDSEAVAVLLQECIFVYEAVDSVLLTYPSFNSLQSDTSISISAFYFRICCFLPSTFCSHFALHFSHTSMFKHPSTPMDSSVLQKQLQCSAQKIQLSVVSLFIQKTDLLRSNDDSMTPSENSSDLNTDSKVSSLLFMQTHKYAQCFLFKWSFSDKNKIQVSRF